MQSSNSESSQTSKSTTAQKPGRPRLKEKTTGGTKTVVQEKLSKEQVVFLGACVIEAARLVTTRDGSVTEHNMINYYKDLSAAYDKLVGE